MQALLYFKNFFLIFLKYFRNSNLSFYSMYFNKIFFSISLFFGVHAIVVAQSSVTVTPENPTIYDTLTITYNASLGNKALMNFSNTVYMHSGLITATSATQSDWKYAIGNWGTDDKPSIMKKMSNNLYQKKIV